MLEEGGGEEEEIQPHFPADRALFLGSEHLTLTWGFFCWQVILTKPA